MRGRHFRSLSLINTTTECAREGRWLIYAAIYPTMNALLAFLTEYCCGRDFVATNFKLPSKLQWFGGRMPRVDNQLLDCANDR